MENPHLHLALLRVGEENVHEHIRLKRREKLSRHGLEESLVSTRTVECRVRGGEAVIEARP